LVLAYSTFQQAIMHSETVAFLAQYRNFRKHCLKVFDHFAPQNGKSRTTESMHAPFVDLGGMRRLNDVFDQ
jgi:hypothetical protein